MFYICGAVGIVWAIWWYLAYRDLPEEHRLVNPAELEHIRGIDEKGNVTDPKVVKASNPDFAAPALEALKKWKFKPAKKGGVPVPIKVAFPIQFSVND